MQVLFILISGLFLFISHIKPSSAVEESTLADQFTIAYSGNLNGEIEPCGCSDGGDFGGIQRQSTLLKRLRQQYPELIVISSGGILSNKVGSSDVIKNNYIISGIEALAIDAIGVQWQDLSLGIERLQQSSIPWLASNWLGKEFSQINEVHRTIEGNKFSLAIFSWLNPQGSPYALMKGTKAEVIEPSSTVLNLALKKAKKAGQTTLLTSAQPFEQLTKFIDIGQVDILIIESAFEFFNTPKLIDSTLILQPGSRGQRMATITINLNNDGKIAGWRQQVFDMPASMPIDPKLDEWYFNYNAEIKADYLHRVAERINIKQGKVDYLGAQQCQNCHEQDYQIWSKTKHAFAFQKLETVEKSFDPSCIQCHTVGFMQTSGFIDALFSSHLKGVQCENCHGQGREHVYSVGTISTKNKLKAMKAICQKCHNHDHSPDFNLEYYWSQIKH